MFMLKIGIRLAMFGLPSMGMFAWLSAAQNSPQATEPAAAATAPAADASEPAGLTQEELDRLGKMMVEGTELFKQGKYDDAARLFLQVVGKDPDNVDAELAYATARFATSDYAAAALSIRRGVTKMPTVVDDPFDMRSNYGNPQAFDVHLKALTDHLKANLNDADAKLVEGFVLHFSGQNAKAEAVFKEVQAKTPTDADVAGVFLMAKGAEPSPVSSSPSEPAVIIATTPVPPPATAPAVIAPAPPPVAAPPIPPAPVAAAPSPAPKEETIVLEQHKTETTFDSSLNTPEPVVVPRYQPVPAVPRPAIPQPVILCRGRISREDEVAPKQVMTVDGLWVKVEDVDRSPRVQADLKIKVQGRHDQKFKNLPVGSELNLLGLSGQPYRLRVEALEYKTETVDFSVWR